MNRLPGLIVLSGLLLAVRAAAGGPAPLSPPVGEVLQRVESRMADVQSVHATFVETKRSPLFDNPLTLRGEIGFVRPARFAWKVREPVAYQLVLDEGVFREWDGETGQVQEGKIAGNPIMGMVVEKLTGFFAGHFLTLTNDFDVTVAALQPLELLCRPRPGSPAAAMGQTLRIQFREDERYVVGLEISDTQGGVTDIRMESIELNAALPPAFWKVPPLE